MVTVRGPQRLTFGSRDVWVWVAVVDGVPHRVAWRPDDGALRVSYPLDDGDRWSRFVTLGTDFSPRRDLRGAGVAVASWAHRQRVRVTR